jgi:hypothetical protein
MLGTLPLDFLTLRFRWSPARRDFAPGFFHTSTRTFIIQPANDHGIEHSIVASTRYSITSSARSKID